jgi:hypothetical protein
MFPVILVHTGFALVFLGLVSLLKPLRFLGIRSRARAAGILAAGLVLDLVGMALPARERRVEQRRTRLDELMPVYQFAELHEIRVPASREETYRAIWKVRADEILLFRTLVTLRRFGRSGPESILNPSEHLPILDVATRTTFVVLADDPGTEILVGTAVVAPRGWRSNHRLTAAAFKHLKEPGFALATMNFHLEDDGPNACRVTTETRVYATDAWTKRRFASYWRVIYPGSALIRRMWLRAIRQRVERPG